MEGQEYVNKGYVIGYRGDRIETKENKFREMNDQYRGLNTIKNTLPRYKRSSSPDEFLEWKVQSGSF